MYSKNKQLGIPEKISVEEFKKLNKKKTYKINNTNKYGAKKQKCNQGHKHDSIDEARYCNKLHILKDAGEIKEIEQQKIFNLPRNGKRKRFMKVDFVVYYHDGSWEIQEYKGFPTRSWAIKRDWFECEYPEIKYIVKTKKDLL